MTFRFRTTVVLRIVAAIAVAAGVSNPASAVNDVVTQWTFEPEPFLDTAGANLMAGPVVGPSTGAGSATGLHASAATDWTTPAGSGSGNSYSSNTWAVGDYYQFQTSTTGILSSLGISFEQAGSGTGPRDFELRYSTDDVTYTPAGPYTVNVSGTPFWDSLVPLQPDGIDRKVFDLSGLGLTNQANVYFRLVNTSTIPTSSHTSLVGTGGTSRVDNFTLYENFNGSLITTPQTAPTPSAPLAGDVVLGMGGERANTTIELVRNGSKPTPYGPWQSPAFVQSVRFDNLNGTTHNVHGNLVGIDFGNALSGITNPTSTGGNIYSFATKGTAPFAAPQVIGNTGNGNTLGVTATRLAGLSVSPDNTKIAVAGFDTRKVLVFDYHPGDGAGAGATTLTGGHESTGTPLGASVTQGTVWKDNNTILALSVQSNTTVDLISINQSDMAETVLVNDLVVPLTSSSKFTSLAYNPGISKYLFATYSGLDGTGGPSTSHVYVFDPTSAYALVKTIDLSAGTVIGPPDAGHTHTIREIALHPDGRIFLSSAGIAPNTPTPGPNPDAGTHIYTLSSSLNPAAIADFSAIEYYTTSSVQAFNSLDIGLLSGDFNYDGTVDAADYVIWRDTDVGGAAGYADWRANFGKSYAAPGSGAGIGSAAVPEPAGAILLLIGALGLWRCRRA